MKKLICILSLLALMLFAVGCAEQSAEETTSEDVAETETADILSEDEIKILYDSAYETYQWFELGKLELEMDDEGMISVYTLEDGSMCGKVADNRVSSMEELNDIVYGTFSSEIAEFLFGYGIYREEDGVLYELMADRGGDITRGKIIEEKVTNATETTFTYTVTVETVDPETMEVTGSEDIDFVAELIDGQWLFTQFCSIY